MKKRPAFALLLFSVLAFVVFLRLRFVIEPPGPASALGIPAAPGSYTTLDLLFIIALFIVSAAKFAEEEYDRPLWPYALAVLFCLYPLLVTIF